MKSKQIEKFQVVPTGFQSALFGKKNEECLLQDLQKYDTQGKQSTHFVLKFHVSKFSYIN